MDVHQKLNTLAETDESKKLNNRLNLYIIDAIKQSIEGASIEGDLEDVGKIARMAMQFPPYLQANPGIHDESDIINNAFNEHAFGSITTDNAEKFLNSNPSLGINCDKNSLAQEIINMSFSLSSEKPELITKTISAIIKQNPIDAQFPKINDIGGYLSELSSLDKDKKKTLEDIASKSTEVQKIELSKFIKDNKLEKEVKEFIESTEPSLKDHPIFHSMKGNEHVIENMLNFLDKRAKNKREIYKLKDYLIENAAPNSPENEIINNLLANELKPWVEKETYQKTLQNLTDAFSKGNNEIFDTIIEIRSMDKQEFLEKIFEKNKNDKGILVKLHDFDDKSFAPIADKALKDIDYLNNLDDASIKSLAPYYNGKEAEHAKIFIKKFLEPFVSDYKKNGEKERVMNDINFAATRTDGVLSNSIFLKEEVKQNIEQYITKSANQDKKWLSNMIGAIYYGTSREKYIDMKKRARIDKIASQLTASGVSDISKEQIARKDSFVTKLQKVMAKRPSARQV